MTLFAFLLSAPCSLLFAYLLNLNLNLNLSGIDFINIGTGKDIKIKDIAKLIKDIVGFDGDIKWDTTKPDGTPRKLLDMSRLKALGWEPKVSLEEGIKRTYDWYKMVCLE